jgi:hypothetical protein
METDRAIVGAVLQVKRPLGKIVAAQADMPELRVVRISRQRTERSVGTARLHALLQGQLLFSAMRLPLSQRNAGGGHEQRGAKRDEAKNESGRHR